MFITFLASLIMGGITYVLVRKISPEGRFHMDSFMENYKATGDWESLGLWFIMFLLSFGWGFFFVWAIELL